jgi:hypothetical protein
MQPYDPIPELEKFGYTERESAFLYLVGMHLGYFLRRQFLASVQREDGAMAQRFLSKSVKLGHAVPIEYAAGRHIYHLRSRIVYRVLEKEDSQLRRPKADREIKSRLMRLDYILDHPGVQFLHSDQQKNEYVQKRVQAQTSLWPETRPGDNPVQPFFGPFPIAVFTGKLGAESLPSFAFVDDGSRSVSAFERWLAKVEPLLLALRHAEIVYVADTRRNLDAAEREFLKRFRRQSNREISIRAHILDYDYPIWSTKYRRSVI